METANHVRTITAACLIACIATLSSPAPAIGSDPGRPSPDPASVSASVQVGDILYELELPDSVFIFPEHIGVVFRVTNLGTVPALFEFWDTRQDYLRLDVRGCGPSQPGCEFIWREPSAFYPMTSDFVLDPQESLEFTSDWWGLRPGPEGVEWLEPGLYTLWGALFHPYLDESLLSLDIEVLPRQIGPIQAALDLASPGDTVFVSPGVHSEVLLLTAQHSGVVLRAEGLPEETVLDGAGRSCVIFARDISSGTAIEGFTVRNGRGGYDRPTQSNLGGAISLRNSPLEIRSNIFRDNASSYDGGAIAAPSHGWVIEGNLFLGNQAANLGGAIWGGGILGSGQVLRNTFVENQARDGGAAALSHSSAENNIFYMNVAAVSGGGLRCQGGVNATTSACNAFHMNLPDDMAYCVDPLHAVFADPLFCDPDGGDFRIDASSPCANHAECGWIGAYGVGCDELAFVEVVPGQSGPVLLAAPNPSNCAVRFVLPDLSAGQSVALEVVSVDGRLVWQAEPREGTIVWDGRDGSGRPIASGVYFARLLSAGSEIARTTLVRAAAHVER